jgi:hypothetical protein
VNQDKKKKPGIRKTLERRIAKAAWTAMGKAIGKGIDQVLEDSGTNEILRKTTNKLRIATMILEARKYRFQGEYQKASDLYLQLAEMDEERRDTYLQYSQDALDLVNRK